jgi:hypothetical protein
VLLAPASLVGLPFAALLVAARPRTRGEWLAVALAMGLCAAWLLAPAAGLFDGLIRAWSVLISVAFAAGAVVRPARFWSLALRASLYAAAGLAVLGRAVAGPSVWSEVQWDVTRAASAAARRVVERAPPLYPLFEPVVRAFAVAWPLWLLLVTLAGLALAWQGHALVARTPLGPPRATPPARPERSARRDAPGGAPAGVVLNH